VSLAVCAPQDTKLTEKRSFDMAALKLKARGLTSRAPPP